MGQGKVADFNSSPEVNIGQLVRAEGEWCVNGMHIVYQLTLSWTWHL